MLKSHKYRIKSKNFVKAWLLKRGFVLVESARYSNVCVALARAVQEILPVEEGQFKAGAEGIVFSKDRPLQLHGLLKSYFELCKDPPQLYILHMASNPDYARAYEQVKSYYQDRNIKFIRENDFRDSLISILNSIESFS